MTYCIILTGPQRHNNRMMSGNKKMRASSPAAPAPAVVSEDEDNELVVSISSPPEIEKGKGKSEKGKASSEAPSERWKWNDDNRLSLVTAAFAKNVWIRVQGEMEKKWTDVAIEMMSKIKDGSIAKTSGQPARSSAPIDHRSLLLVVHSVFICY